MESTHCGRNIGKMDPVSVIDFLSPYTRGKKTVTRSGKNQLKIECEDSRSANSLKKGFTNAFLSSRSIKDIIRICEDGDLTNILNIKRVIDQGNHILDRDEFTFNGPLVPRNIQLGGYLIQITLVIQRPRRCFRCQRFCHVANQCRSAYPSCKFCAGRHFTSVCPNGRLPPSCNNCKKNHMASSSDCPIFKLDFGFLKFRYTTNCNKDKAKMSFYAENPDLLNNIALCEEISPPPSPHISGINPSTSLHNSGDVCQNSSAPTVTETGTSTPRRYQSLPIDHVLEISRAYNKHRLAEEIQVVNSLIVLNQYKSKTDAIVKRTTNEARRQSFRDFCNSLDRHTPLNKIWSVVRAFKNRFTQPQTASCSAEKETIDNLHSLIKDLYPPTAFYENFPNNFYNNPFLETPFTFSELKLAVNSSKTKSSPGLDKIDFNTIQHFPDEVLLVLLSIINRIITSRKYPPSWNNFLIFFIPKSTPGKFRPISLASCLFKITEKLIYNRLLWLIERDKILSPYQFGFRKGRSCSDNLALISTEIWSGLSQREFIGALFLDIKGAFPSVIPNILAEDLRTIGIPESITRFIYDSIKCKNMFFKINGEIIGPRNSTIGVPQGSILSPLNFGIYTRDLNTIIPADCKIYEFADDWSVISRSHDPNQIIASLQNCLNIMSEFLSDRGLEICPIKTQLVIFNNQKLNIDDPTFSLSLNEFTIKPSPSAKYLGVFFHESGSSDTHFNYLCDRVTKILNILKVLRGTWWGADPYLLLHIYDSLIRSLVDYGSLAANFKTHKNFSRLEKLRNRALRIFSNSNHPLPAKLSELSQLTINSNVRFNYPLLIAYEKTKNYSELIRSKDIDPYFEFLFEDHLFTPKIVLNWGKSLQDSSSASNLFKDLVNYNFHNHTLFFTDGSKSETDRVAGCASVCPSLNLSFKFKIQNHASVFSLEAFAILFTLDHIINSNLSNTVIFTDSLSVLNNLASKNIYRIKSYIILTIRNRLNVLSKLNRPVTLVWIPGHTGIDGNEEADKAAKDASTEPVTLNIPLSFTDFSCLARKQLVDSCNTYFLEIGQNKGTQYMQYFYKPTKKPWFANFVARRLWITTICRVRSNHYNLNFSLARKNIVQSGKCPQCPNIEEDFDHILWACPRFDPFRPDLIKALSRALKCPPPFSSVQFLSNPIPKIVSPVFRFLKRANLQI
ncbi:uncharacterized protein LOC127280379 [Leptopilina boulardi]|uniref:uncharacterized protein LOC127280379 n=1 Tax=Leptopilina boulardi TaxID=63433 RepID=UPI0021F5DB0E|nr:uncharacterized protein LOC127280379 [Leptopilina boulardi]